jgi:hypothetical protein
MRRSARNLDVYGASRMADGESKSASFGSVGASSLRPREPSGWGLSTHAYWDVFTSNREALLVGVIPAAIRTTSGVNAE